jgi:hypothetical protein
MSLQARDEQEEWPGPMFPPERRVFMPISEHRLQLAANRELVEARKERARMARHARVRRQLEEAREARIVALEREQLRVQKAAAAHRGGRRKGPRPLT